MCKILGFQSLYVAQCGDFLMAFPEFRNTVNLKKSYT